MRQGLAEQGMDGEQEHSHLEWPDATRHPDVCATLTTLVCPSWDIPGVRCAEARGNQMPHTQHGQQQLKGLNTETLSNAEDSSSPRRGQVLELSAYRVNFSWQSRGGRHGHLTADPAGRLISQ